MKIREKMVWVGTGGGGCCLDASFWRVEVRLWQLLTQGDMSLKLEPKTSRQIIASCCTFGDAVLVYSNTGRYPCTSPASCLFRCHPLQCTKIPSGPVISGAPMAVRLFVELELVLVTRALYLA